ncbi:hypothetical protein EDD80_11575 [Anseongella ginsenosidimutans]|uniref:Uncharacterized protein n=1 Tax=Anseongella ginsenosidimutans TaxID=496056 RepID=A0A4R3KM17_9SPHI|nr:hypothetical protein [Anseongella ginsenosidimutans]QEC51888.1 hypothetical protein FRZ59_05755 [Anseongella ginsenosidimutans]TCS85092.1 hypothetical protein EDD80_11575 [Anseongella ginsenosidimutans]
MSLDRIRLSTALKVLEPTRKKAESVGGIAPGHIYFYNSAVFNRREWSSYITGSRSDYDLAFDPDVNLKYFRRR